MPNEYLLFSRSFSQPKVDLLLIAFRFASHGLNRTPEGRLGLGSQIQCLFQGTLGLLPVLQHLTQESNCHRRRFKATSDILPQAKVMGDRRTGVVHP